ncbi:hypothetical protein B5P44_00530 [Mycobacterium sp. CBMA 213]|uniref:Uncharacterized protein n=1 Tax=Mycolicibacterium sp. CBMA 213 TaxID=1968788 RepID=A0A343VR89_9MYCO|nr:MULTISPECIES: hypothetical protein [unclassified Mycolicibacterium]AVN58413.1 hypothetical protein B5P44_p00118 [Mycolicibacterium sp. CBMA 213]MUL61071.1 hypothetical protein [Mycolicibacterium sp. CBMA 335]MUM03309.1 hypothetical protein [Mycolicibacterium sp. CBMA 213]
MGAYDEVVLTVRDGKGDRHVARIDPGDFPEDTDLNYARTVGAGGLFDPERLPTVVRAAGRYFGRRISAVWVDDRGDDLYFEPELPYLVPPEYEVDIMDDRRTLIRLAGI